MASVDLKELKVGDSLVFRSGETATVTDIERFKPKDRTGYYAKISFANSDGGDYWHYQRSGTLEKKRIDRADIVEFVSSPSGLGAKFDAGKLLWRPLMNGLALPLRSLAAVLSYGAQKYEEDSWQTVPEGRVRYENAYLRHANERAGGEVYDKESALPHIAHMIINLMLVMWFEVKDGVIKNLTEFHKPPTKK